jgi:hypothetical protein
MTTAADGTIWEVAVEMASLQDVASALCLPFDDGDNRTWMTEQMIWIYAWATNVTVKFWK